MCPVACVCCICCQVCVCVCNTFGFFSLLFMLQSGSGAPTLCVRTLGSRPGDPQQRAHPSVDSIDTTGATADYAFTVREKVEVADSLFKRY